MLQRHALLAAALLTAAATAQQSTLPIGMLHTNGGKIAPFPFDFATTLRYQEVHRPMIGARPPIFTKIRFRRAIKTAVTTATARTADLTLWMGQGDVTKFTSAFATNFTSAPTQVLPKTKTNLPDWSAAKSLSQYLDWDLTIPFKAPFAPDGKTDIIWDLTYENASVKANTGYVAERVGNLLPYSVDRGTTFLTGCKATGQAQPMQHRFALFNYGSSHPRHPMRMLLTSGNNAAFKPVQVAIGFQRLDIQVASWCERLFPDPQIFIPLGTAGLFGGDLSVNFDLPYLPAAIKLPIYTQAFSPDDQLPDQLALSNGCSAAMPSVAFQGGSFLYTYSTTLPATTGTSPSSSGSVLTVYN